LSGFDVGIDGVVVVVVEEVVAGGGTAASTLTGAASCSLKFLISARIR
jgi:hypothetical protein